MTSESELSEREIEILQLVATGASNKEIAQKLVISPNTVKVHLRNIFAKINASSRTEATLYAVRCGLVASPREETSVPLENQQSALVAPDEMAVDQPEPRKLPRAMVAGLIVLIGVLLLASFWGGQRLAAGQSTATPANINPAIERWKTWTPLDFPRGEMAAARYEGIIYLFGGESSAGLQSQMLKYNPEDDSISQGTALPYPVKGAQAALVGELIYLPGGESADGTPFNQVLIYDPRRESWAEAAPLPQALSRYALTSFEGELYLFGGWDGQQYVASVLRYDPVADEWQERQPLPSPCGLAAAVEMEGKIYLFGGTDGQQVSAEAVVYYPQREDNGEDAWEERASLPAGRYGMAGAELAGQIYLFGGHSTLNQSDLPAPLQYSPLQDDWSDIEPVEGAQGSGIALAVYNTQVHLFGGRQGDTLRGDHLTYQAVFNILLPLVQDNGGPEPTP